MAASARYTFSVEWAIKGPIQRTMRIASGVGGGDCGLGDVLNGERIGLVYRIHQGEPFASIVDKFDPDELLRAARSLSFKPRRIYHFGFIESPSPFASPWLALYVPVAIVFLTALRFGYRRLILRSSTA
jgi:hypothetical protein